MALSRPVLSIVIPVFNGADLVGDLHRALAPVLREMPQEAEIVFVDDGSTDGTVEALLALQKQDPAIRIVELAANFGQHAAFSAGFDHARGDYLVTMDADLQCDPRDIPKLIAPLQQGYDVVSGVRQKRRDPLLRRWFSAALTWLVARMSGVRLRDVGCPFNAFTREVAGSLAAFGELRRFLKPVGIRLARRVMEVEVTHNPRPLTRPRSTYSATGLVRLFMDFFVTGLGDVFAWIFLVASGLAGVGFAATLAGLAAFVAGAVPAVMPAGLATMTFGATLLALFGLGGDYVQRIYRQSSGRPFYLVRRVHETDEAYACR
jgi:glycosyltransferase involved in cell wall biosynthesis